MLGIRAMILTMSPGLNSMKAIDLAVELAAKKNVQNIIPREKLFIDRGCVHWSKMSGKMFGKRAIGRPMTSRCLENQKIDGCICQKCYATRINQVYPSMGAALQRNRDLDVNDILEDPPSFTTTDLTWRSNWNGDYEDEHDVLVDFAICDVLNYAICTAWTKQGNIVERVIDERPSNYTLMQSSYMINQQDDMWDFADQIFTNYTADYAAENDIDINCIGACRLCKRCYGDLSHRPKVVNELLKGDEIKYFKLMGIDL